MKTKLLVALASLTLTGTSILPVTNILADSSPQVINVGLDFKQAAQTALNEAKSDKLVQLELENDRSRPVYEITILDGTTEKEYKIDANSGKILKSSHEDISDDLEDIQLSQTTPGLSLVEAGAKAKEQHNTAQLREIELEMENGRLVYKVKMSENNHTHKLVIDANNGSLISDKTK